MKYPLKLQELLEFTSFFHKFQRITRTIYVNGEERLENDVEHSYQLALTSWFIANTQNLNLNSNLIIKYALIHDLAEVYAGDPYFYSNDPNKDLVKKSNEEMAISKIKDEFPTFCDLFELLKKYEEKEDEESKFVYALDKIIPMVNELLNEGKSIKEYKLSLEEIIKGKEQKVKVSIDAKYYYDIIIELFKNNEEQFCYIKNI